MLATDPFCQETLPLLRELRRTARRYVGERGDLADDLVQETWLRAYAARHRFQPGSNARAWMHAILLNAARTNYRREGRERRLAERYAADPTACRWIAPPPTLPAAREAVPAAAAGPSLRERVAALPESYRRAIELVDLQGLGYREAARRLGCPIGTVMSRLHRGRRRLRAALEVAR